MGRVAELGCAICRIFRDEMSPAQVHHVFDTAERSDWLVIPLCPEHHTGATGFHGLGERAFNARYKTSEAHLLSWTIEELNA